MHGRPKIKNNQNELEWVDDKKLSDKNLDKNVDSQMLSLDLSALSLQSTPKHNPNILFQPAPAISRVPTILNINKEMELSNSP